MVLDAARLRRATGGQRGAPPARSLRVPRQLDSGSGLSPGLSHRLRAEAWPRSCVGLPHSSDQRRIRSEKEAGARSDHGSWSTRTLTRWTRCLSFFTRVLESQRRSTSHRPSEMRTICPPPSPRSAMRSIAAEIGLSKSVPPPKKVSARSSICVPLGAAPLEVEAPERSAAVAEEDRDHRLSAPGGDLGQGDGQRLGGELLFAAHGVADIDQNQHRTAALPSLDLVGEQLAAEQASQEILSSRRRP